MISTVFGVTTICVSKFMLWLYLENIMEILQLLKLPSIMKLSSGNPDLIVGMIDGPIDLKHDAFDNTHIIQVSPSYPILCNSIDDKACKHGTSITGILAAKRGVHALSICPSCTFALRPIFYENSKCVKKPNINDLADAIIETVDAGARIINLSLGLTYHLGTPNKLKESYSYARDKGVVVIISSGNQGQVGNSSLLRNQWIIPVSSCDQNGRPLWFSNLGKDIGKNGILAPGTNIKSTFPNGAYGYCGGTSVSAALVSGTIALLWSIYPESTSTDIIYAVRKSCKSHSIVPPLLNAEAASDVLRSTARH